MPEASRLTPETLRSYASQMDMMLPNSVLSLAMTGPQLRLAADAWQEQVRAREEGLEAVYVAAKEYIEAKGSDKHMAAARLGSALSASGAWGYREGATLKPPGENALADSGKEIERLETEVRYHQHDRKLLEGEIMELREQLRAYRGAERIAHDQLEGKAWD